MINILLSSVPVVNREDGVSIIVSGRDFDLGTNIPAIGSDRIRYAEVSVIVVEVVEMVEESVLSTSTHSASKSVAGEGLTNDRSVVSDDG